MSRDNNLEEQLLDILDDLNQRIGVLEDPGGAGLGFWDQCRSCRDLISELRNLSNSEVMNRQLMGAIQDLSLAEKQDLLNFIIQSKVLAQQLADNREAQRTANARPPQGSANAGGNETERV